MKQKILIVEDEDDIRNFLKESFTMEHFECITVSTGKKAKELVKKVNPDLIILDLQLPDLNGFKILASIRRDCNNVPVIIISGVYIKDKDVVEGLNSGADDYIRKPFYIEELIIRVKRKIERNSFNH